MHLFLWYWMKIYINWIYEAKTDDAKTNRRIKTTEKFQLKLKLNTKI